MYAKLEITNFYIFGGVMMKKILSIALALVIALCSVACLAKEEDGTKLNIDGETKTLIAYNINDNNYFKLRDVANVLKGTNAHFDVLWNEEKQAIELISGTDYSTDESVTSEKIENAAPVKSDVTIYKDGIEILLNAYNINDNNFFKLRDLASAIDFNVDYNESINTIEVFTAEPYEYPEANGTEIYINTKYPSFMGMTKEFIDNKCGNEGSYSGEFGTVDYGNGFMAGYGRLGIDDVPQKSDYASSLFITLENLLFNCPDTITVEQVKNVFGEAEEVYDEMYEENILVANYCGKAVVFYGMGKDDYVSIGLGTYKDTVGYEPQPMADYTGFYKEDDDAYITVTYRTDGWTVEPFVARNFNDGHYTLTKVADRVFTFEGNFGGGIYQLEWSEDYNTVKMYQPEYLPECYVFNFVRQ